MAPAGPVGGLEASKMPLLGACHYVEKRSSLGRFEGFLAWKERVNKEFQGWCVLSLGAPHYVQKLTSGTLVIRGLRVKPWEAV